MVLFVITGAIVGYVIEAQGNTASLPAAGHISGGPLIPDLAQQPVTLFSYTATLATTTAGAIPSGGSYSTSFGGRMIELEGFLTVQVDDSRGASDQLVQLTSSLGGYVAASSFDEAGPSANVVLRVPQQNFSLAMQRIAAFGKVQSQSTSSNDVTEQYANMQAELTSYKTEEAALLRILNSSTTVRDALATQDTIQNVQARINEIEGQLRVMQRLVAFSTINVQFTQPIKSKTPNLDFGDLLQSALLSFYIVVKGILILAASLAPIVMLGGIAYYPYRRYSKNKGKPAEAKNE